MQSIQKPSPRCRQDGRASWADLGTALGLSAPAAAERVRKLVDGGIVRGFTAVLDPETAGFPVLAFVAVTLEAAGRAPCLPRRRAAARR